MDEPFQAICRLCGREWRASFEAEPVADAQYRLECPDCGHQAGEPLDEPAPGE